MPIFRYITNGWKPKWENPKSNKINSYHTEGILNKVKRFLIRKSSSQKSSGMSQCLTINSMSSKTIQWKAGVNQAILKFPPAKKSPGPECFTDEFHQMFKEIWTFTNFLKIKMNMPQPLVWIITIVSIVDKERKVQINIPNEYQHKIPNTILNYHSIGRGLKTINGLVEFILPRMTNWLKMLISSSYIDYIYSIKDITHLIQEKCLTKVNILSL